MQNEQLKKTGARDFSDFLRHIKANFGFEIACANFFFKKVQKNEKKKILKVAKWGNFF